METPLQELINDLTPNVRMNADWIIKRATELLEKEKRDII